MKTIKHSFNIIIKDVDTKEEKETVSKGKITIKFDDNINIINKEIYSDEISLIDYESQIINAIKELYDLSYTTVDKIE